MPMRRKHSSTDEPCSTVSDQVRAQSNGGLDGAFHQRQPSEEWQDGHYDDNATGESESLSMIRNAHDCLDADRSLRKYPQKKLNARLVDSMNEVLTMSNLIIEELIQEIIAQVASLYKVGEDHFGQSRSEGSSDELSASAS